MSRRLQLGVTALLGVLALAGCTAPASPGPGAATTRGPGRAAGAAVPSASGPVLRALRAKLTCPPRQPQPEPGPPGSRGAGPVLRPAPVIAVFCQYNARHYPAIPAPVPRIVLTGAAAAGLSAMIDGLRPVQFQDLGCPGASPRYSQTIFFGYSSGRAATATVTYCPAMIRISGQLLQVSGPVADDLSAYAAGVWHNGGPRTPDLIGMSLPRAEAAAGHAGMTVSLSGAEPDAGAPFGSVIFQALPARYPSRLHNGPQVAIVVAAGSAPACTRSQLRLAYRADGARSGSDFGAVVIADAGSAPCTLSGLVQIAGLSRAGRIVTTTFRSRLAASVTLTPHAGPVPEDTGAPSVIPLPPPGLDGAIWFAEEYRDRPDSPAGTLCRPAWVTPATWHVVLPGGLAFSVPNADPGGPDPIVPSGGFVTCGGRLDDATLIYYGQPLS